MANRIYAVEIAETSRELSAKERIALKDTTSARRLDEATTLEDVIIYPEAWAILNVHNEKADDKEYQQYILLDKSGEKFVTGSPSFWNAFMDIYTEMAGESEEWGIKVYRMESKNYKGKSFITCSII